MSPGARPSAVTARSGTNIALVKYWGKRDAALNLPATGSLSLTLDGLGSETRVRFIPGSADRVLLDDAPADAAFARRVSRFLDLVRARARVALRAEVATRNTVPTAAGLASSASGFAALALAATRAAGLTLSPAELSALARCGSGSAARSILGGFVEMARGERADGEDACAHPLLGPEAWDVRLVVAVTDPGPKPIGSTEAMERSARTSPYYAAWLSAVEQDLGEARAAVLARDLEGLGAVAERNALRMHACAMAADPPIVYFAGATVEALRAVRALRVAGTRAWATIDAGPHVKALCAASDAPAVEAALRATSGVRAVVIAKPGPGAVVVEETV
jgi:diphosphomevalonate decarboxylase